MSSILNMLNFGEEDGLNLLIIVPVFAVVVVAFTILLKFSLRRPEVTQKTKNSVKKQQKSQVSNNNNNNNKQKEEKINNEKKEKVLKEKKLSSSSPAKSLDKHAGNESAKTKPNKKQQQSTTNEKVTKKISAQTKKQQANNNNNIPYTKNNQISNKKQTVDIFINKEEEGEWQMVTTKKQKQNKQEEKVEIATTPTKAGKKLQKSPEKANKQAGTKNKKVKEITEKSDNSTKFFDSEVTSQEVPNANSDPKENIKETIENSFIATVEAAKVATVSKSIPNTLVSNNEIKTPTVQDETTPVANVAFDELGDDGWTNTKPQKKNRKRALRE